MIFVRNLVVRNYKRDVNVFAVRKRARLVFITANGDVLTIPLCRSMQVGKFKRGSLRFKAIIFTNSEYKSIRHEDHKEKV